MRYTRKNLPRVFYATLKRDSKRNREHYYDGEYSINWYVDNDIIVKVINAPFNLYFEADTLFKKERSMNSLHTEMNHLLESQSHTLSERLCSRFKTGRDIIIGEIKHVYTTAELKELIK